MSQDTQAQAPRKSDGLKQETHLQQRLKGHLKDFQQDASKAKAAKGKARQSAVKSDEDIRQDLTSKEALEMRGFRGSEVWLTHLAATMDGNQILAPKWDTAMEVVPAANVEVPGTFEPLVTLHSTSADGMDSAVPSPDGGLTVRDSRMHEAVDQTQVLEVKAAFNGAMVETKALSLLHGVSPACKIMVEMTTFKGSCNFFVWRLLYMRLRSIIQKRLVRR